MNPNIKQTAVSFVALPMQPPPSNASYQLQRLVAGAVISDIAPPPNSRPAPRPSSGLPEPSFEHKQYNPRPMAQKMPQRLLTTQKSPATDYSPHHIAVTSPQPALTAAADSLVIRMTIPNPRNLKLPEFVKEYRAFWWILAIFGLLLFTIGYVVGHHAHLTAPAAPPAAVMHWPFFSQGVNRG